MRCAGCDADLAVSNVFPGGLVTCAACKTKNRVPDLAHAPHEGTPYRSANSRPTLEPPLVTCPFCGGECRPDARACPHCDVKLSSVRCATCFALQTTGQRTCARCGHELDLEPLLDSTDAPCPRCERALEAVPGDGGMNECAGCGGLFVDHATLARIVETRESSGPLPIPDARPFELARKELVETSVRYVKCPLCHQTMNRVNFGRKSGVVVDVCKKHGTWFDAGELTQAVEWVSSGGLDLARKQDAAKSRDGGKGLRLVEVQAIAQASMMNEAMRETRDLGRRVALTEDLVDAAIRTLLRW